MAESTSSESLTIGGETVYTVAGVAAELGLHPERARHLIRSRGVGQRVGRQTLVTATELETLRERKHGRPPVVDS